MLKQLFNLLPVLLLVACGGGGTGDGGGGGGSPPPPPPPPTFTVGGSVTGLAGSGLVLQNNAGADLAVNAASSFTFNGALASGSAYSITVLTQPDNPSQTCTVSNGAGTVSANVTNVAVNCTTNSFAVGATVSGLAGAGLVLQINGGNELPIAADGTTRFAGDFESGTTFDVRIVAPPARPVQTCVLDNATGTIGSADVLVNVRCTTEFARFAFVTDQVAGTVSTYAVDALSGRASLRGYALSETAPTAAATTPDQRFVFVANQGSDDISAFRVDAATGALGAVAGSPFAAGDAPQDVLVDASGRFLLASNFFSGTISVFGIDATTGALNALPGSPVAVRGTNPGDIVIDPAGRLVFIGNAGSNDVTVMELTSAGELREVTGSPFGTGVANPAELVVSQDGRFLYVASAASNSIAAFSVNAAGSLSPVPGSPFPTGTNPVSLVLDGAGRFAYVANGLSNDLHTFAVNRTSGALTEVAGGRIVTDEPCSLAIDPSGASLYVSSCQRSTLSTFRLNQDTGVPELSEVHATRRAPSAIAIARGTARLVHATRFAYVANSASDNISVLNLAGDGGMNGQSVPAAAGDSPLAFAVHPGGRFGYAVHNGSDDVIAYNIDTDTGSLTLNGAPTPSGDGTNAGPVAIVIEPSGRFAYVANTNDGTITTLAIDAANGELTRLPSQETGVGLLLQSLVMDPSGQFLYAGTLQNENISAFRIAAGDGRLSLIGTVASGGDVQSMSIDRAGTRLYALSFQAESVSAFTINRNSGALTALGPAHSVSVFPARSPRAIAVNPATNRVHVTNATSDTITRMDIDDRGIQRFFEESPAHNSPADVDIDADGRFAYIADVNEGTVTSYDVSGGAFIERDSVTVGTGPVDVELYEAVESSD